MVSSPRSQAAICSLRRFNNVPHVLHSRLNESILALAQSVVSCKLGNRVVDPRDAFVTLPEFDCFWSDSNDVADVR